MGELAESVHEARLDLEGAVGQGILNVIDDCLGEIRILDRFNITMDGGKSFDEYWRRGDDVFRKLIGALASALAEVGQAPP